MHSGICMISVRIQVFVCDQSQYAYGDSYKPCMHTGTVFIPVCIKQLQVVLSHYVYGDVGTSASNAFL